MKSKSKKLIIIIASIVVVVIAGLIGFVVLSNLTTTTVNDLRIIDAVSGEEISEKEVYLTAKDENYFDIKLQTSASSLTSYIVLSNNTSIAYVSSISGGYRVYYSKPGEVKIFATTQEASDISDVITVNVKEFVPTEVLITDEKAIDVDKIEIFSDNREYRFGFDVFQGSIKENINISSIKVLDNYDKSVFKSIEIDDINSELVISAYQSEVARKEIITLQTIQADSEGNNKTVQNFVVEVDIKGNYISDIQLMLSITPNFTTSINIYGEGLLNEGEKRAEAVYLTDVVHTVYAKVRAVYTNGEMFDVTNNVVTTVTSGNQEATSRPQLSDYHAIDIKPNGSEPQTAIIKFSYNGKETSLAFNYLKEGEDGYNNFYDNKLYKIVTDYDGNTYYEYVYWDTRFERNDAITDEEGRIVRFVGTAPTCAG